MPDLPKTAQRHLSAVSPPASAVCIVSPFLQRCWTLSCLNQPDLRSQPCLFQNQTEFHPIRRCCPPDTGRQRRLFFCSFCGIRSVSASRYGRGRFPEASAVACLMCACRTDPYYWQSFLHNPPLNLQRWTAWARGRHAHRSCRWRCASPDTIALYRKVAPGNGLQLICGYAFVLVSALDGKLRNDLCVALPIIRLNSSLSRIECFAYFRNGLSSKFKQRKNGSSSGR